MSNQRQFFGTDGVRAKANVAPMTPEFVLRLGQAAANVLAGAGNDGRRPLCVIGRDTRASGEMFEAALIAGLNAIGVDVALAGVVPTPAVALLCPHMGACMGVVISASHNPFTDNGIKILRGDGRKLDDATEWAIEQEALRPLGDAQRARGQAIGRVTRLEDAAKPFVDHAVASMRGVRLDGMRIILDNANGAAGVASARALSQLGAQVQCFHDAPDGYNINEECGCTHPEIIESLMKTGRADVGLAHDGDADRLVLCDEFGVALDGDELMAIAADFMLREGSLQQRTLAVTIMSNFGLDAMVRELGGSVIRTAVGDRYVLEAMQKQGLNLGGEQSGHIVFGDWCTTGDGLIAALQVLRIMRLTGRPLSELRRCLRLFPQVKRDVRVSRKPALDGVEGVMTWVRCAEKQLEGCGRVLLRYSGTESILRILVEGPETVDLQALVRDIEAAVLENLG